MEKTKTQKLPEKVENLKGVGIPNLTASCLQRTGDKAIYERADGVYEVFKIKVQEAGEMFGTWYPRREMYPNNEDFGKTAWSFRSKEKAFERYKKI